MTRNSILTFLATLTLAAPVLADDHDHHVSELEGIRVIHAWTRATDDGTAYVFCDIENAGISETRLIGGEAEIAESAALVGFRLNSSGEGVYEGLPSIPVKAGSELLLAPKGAAIRLSGLNRTLAEGEEFEMEMEFDSGHMEIHVAVEAAGATRHSHAGHSH